MESTRRHPDLKINEQLRSSPLFDQQGEAPGAEKRTVPLTQDAYRFDLGREQYLRIRIVGVLFLCALIICACIAVAIGILWWKSYPHNFTPYLKWQDALLGLSWFIAFVVLGGGILVIRFLHALRAGYTQGMVTLVEDPRKECDSTITVRDLSADNLKSIFWIMNSAFWCFVAVLIGLSPAMLIGWTLHLSNLALIILATSIAIALSLAGLIVSIVAAFFIVVGCIGLVSFCRKLGSSHTYQLDKQATIRIDSFTLTITYPAEIESLVDLNLLTSDDRGQLLSLLRKRWIDTEQVLSPSLDYSHTRL